jgi:hypothetical protein
MTFFWIMPLLFKGFLKPLELSDLGNLAEKDQSRYHYDQFLFIYQSTKVSSLFFAFIHDMLVYSLIPFDKCLSQLCPLDSLFAL